MTKTGLEKETIKIERLFLDEKKISPHLICSICKKVFNNPVLIDCGHTFCFECIKKKLKENDNQCPKCHEKNFTLNFSRDLMAYNLVMELDVSCNNVGKCPWIGHLSELVTHQTICDKTMKILEENKKKRFKNLSKRFSYEKEEYIYKKENKKNDSVCFSEKKINKISKDGEIMINNLKIEKKQFFDSTNVKKRELNNKEDKENFKHAFS